MFRFNHCAYPAKLSQSSEHGGGVPWARVRDDEESEAIRIGRMFEGYGDNLLRAYMREQFAKEKAEEEADPDEHI